MDLWTTIVGSLVGGGVISSIINYFVYRKINQSKVSLNKTNEEVTLRRLDLDESTFLIDSLRGTLTTYKEIDRLNRDRLKQQEESFNKKLQEQEAHFLEIMESQTAELQAKLLEQKESFELKLLALTEENRKLKIQVDDLSERLRLYIDKYGEIKNGSNRSVN